MTQKELIDLQLQSASRFYRLLQLILQSRSVEDLIISRGIETIKVPALITRTWVEVDTETIELAATDFICSCLVKTIDGLFGLRIEMTVCTPNKYDVVTVANYPEKLPPNWEDEPIEALIAFREDNWQTENHTPIYEWLKEFFND